MISDYYNIFHDTAPLISVHSLLLRSYKSITRTTITRQFHTRILPVNYPTQKPINWSLYLSYSALESTLS